MTLRTSRRPAAAALLLALALPLGGCVTYPPGWDPETQGGDPYQGANRVVFGFNEGVDRLVLAPLARGWTAITFEAMRASVGRFFDNLSFPSRFVASLGQGQLGGAGREAGRFATNTTVGVLGLFDPAARLGLEPTNEDFGQMLGAWGIPAGPYWCVPLLGPSSPRDLVGGVFDAALDLGLAFSIVGIPGVGFLEIVNARALAEDRIRRAREAALDYYVAVRDAHVERRRALVRNRDAPDALDPGALDALYEIEEEDAEPAEAHEEGAPAPAGDGPAPGDPAAGAPPQGAPTPAAR